MIGQPPWWAMSAISAANVILGTAIGFFLTQLKDRLERKRSERAFLIAIKYELRTMKKQLEQSFTEIHGSKNLLSQGVAPHLVVKLSTKIFDTQLSRLSGLSDPLILKVVNFYSTLDMVDDLASGINKQSDKFEAATGAVQSHFQSCVMSALMVTEENLERYQRMLNELLPQLPDDGGIRDKK